MQKLVRWMAPLCCLALTLGAQTRTRNNRNLNISTEGRAESCADLHVRSNGEVARVNEKYTLQPGEAAGVELDAQDRGVIQVRGWNQSAYQVEACKVAVAEDHATAERMAHAIAVSHSAGRFTYNGPGDSAGNWQIYFIVHVPANAQVDLATKNGPVSVADVSGTVKLRAVNGPLAIRNCAGNIDAQTTNGPISFEGSSGEVHLHAHNGPIALKLSQDAWNGALLDAQTENGPVSLKLPDAFRSGVRIETGDNAPLSCRICAQAIEQKNGTSGARVIQLNGTSDTVRVVTHNGPVSVGSGANAKGKIL